MALEVWNSSTNLWNAMTDPEVWDGTNWININKGQVWDGTDWITFYQRNNNEVYSDLDTISKTKTSIKLGVNHTGTDRRKAEVWISGQFLTTLQVTNVFTTSNMVSSNAAAQVDFAGLTLATSYSFDSRIAYLDASDNVISYGATMITLHTDTTLDHAITIPTTPVNTGTVTSTILSFKASSNANYSSNVVAATLYFYLYDAANVLQQTKSSALPNNDTLTERTVTFNNVDYGTPHYCKARTYYGGAINAYSSYSSNSSTETTNTFHVPIAPGRLDAPYTTDTAITMLSTGNAYSNGDAYMKLEKATRPATSNDDNDWVYTSYSDSGNLLTNDSTTRYVAYTFTGLNQTNEYKFRARVFYGDLTTYTGTGLTSGNAAYGPYSAIVRPRLWERQYKPSSVGHAAASETTYFPGSSFGSSSENGAAIDDRASDNSLATEWQAYPYIYVNDTMTVSRSLVYFKRDITNNGNYNTYYVSSDFDFDPDYLLVVASVTQIYYDVTSCSLQKGGNIKITLDSSNVIDLVSGDDIRLSSTSSGTYDRSYNVSSASGNIVYATPLGGSISTPSSATGGRLFVDTSRGFSKSVFGGTSNRVGQGSNYVLRLDSDYGYSVPLSAAFGSVSYTVDTSVKVPKTSSDIDNVSVIFVPALPDEYQNARLDQVKIQIGSVQATRLKVEINGTERFDSAGYPISANTEVFVSGFSATPTYAGNAFLINCIVYPGYNSDDGLYYSTIKEIQLRYSYEILTG